MTEGEKITHPYQKKKLQKHTMIKNIRKQVVFRNDDYNHSYHIEY